MKSSSIAAACGLVVGLAAIQASAGTLVIELDKEYSGAAAPAGTAPWARATFTDKGGGVVGLVLECLLQDTNEFMAKANGTAGWAFNLDPSLDPDDLTFTDVGSGPDVAASAILTGANDFNAGPDKFYDVVFQFGSGMIGGQVARYDLSIAGGGLLASSFDFVSNKGYHSSVHVQGVRTPSSGQGSSGWVGGGEAQVIPLPAAGAMGLAGLGAVATRRRRAMP